MVPLKNSDGCWYSESERSSGGTKNGVHWSCHQGRWTQDRWTKMSTLVQTAFPGECSSWLTSLFEYGTAIERVHRKPKLHRILHPIQFCTKMYQPMHNKYEINLWLRTLWPLGFSCRTVCHASYVLRWTGNTSPTNLGGVKFTAV